MDKIKNIEFLRIIGCLAIILLHFFNKNHINVDFFTIPLYSKLNIMTSNGDKAVDLFFILSGLFFVLKINLNESIWNFLKKKLIKFYPVLIFLILISMIFSFLGILKWDLYSNIMLLLGLNGTSLVTNVALNTNLSQFWYISAILWIFTLYLYLLKNYNEKTVDLIIAIITFFAYSFIIHAKGGRISGTHQTFYYIFNIGMLRAFGGVGIGYFIGKWWKENSQKIKVVSLNLFQVILVSVLEFSCLYFIINNLMLHKLSYKNQMIFIVVFALTVILFLVNKGIISKLLNNDKCELLARYTFSIYMVHNLIYHILRGSVWKNYPEYVFQHPVLNIFFTITIIIICGIIIHHLIEKTSIDYYKANYEKISLKIFDKNN